MFNPDKLDWFNGQYLARLAPRDLVARVKPQLVAAGLWRRITRRTGASGCSVC